MLVIVSRVDGEHQLLHQAGVQNGLGQLRGVGAEADVPDHPGLFHFQQIIQHPVLLVLGPVRGRVQAVDEAKVDVVRPEGAQLPVHLALDGLQIGGPAVFPGLVVGPEVDLIQHLPPHRGKRLPGVAEGAGPRRGKVYVVDPLLVGIGQGGQGFLFGRFEDGAGPQADHADPVPRFGVYAVFHVVPSRCVVCLCLLL